MSEATKIISFESEGGGAFGDVLTRRSERRPLKVGVLCLGYFEYWRMYPPLEELVRKDLAGAAKRVKAALPGMEVVTTAMVDTLDRAHEAGVALRDADVEAVVVIEGTYIPDFITMHALDQLSARPYVVLFNTQTGADVNPEDNYMATMRNSSLIGISQLTGSFRKMKLDYAVVVGEIAEEAPYREIAAKLTALEAARDLKRSTYGLIGHVFRGMFDLEFDRAKVKGYLGPEVMTIQVEHLIDAWKTISAQETDDAARALFQRFKKKHIEFDDVKRSVQVGLAMRKLYERFNLDGLCFLGQHYIEKMTGAPARMGASMLMEQERRMVACEGDIAGLVMMELLTRFTGNLPFQAEWGQFDRANNAMFLLGHGIGAASLAKSDADIYLTHSPEEWGFKGSGLNYQLILRPGRVTMGHFINTGDSWQMLISGGESLDYPALPCDELHAMVKVASPVEEYVKSILEIGTAHHIVVAHGDAKEQLRLCAEMMRIKSVIVE